VVRENVFEIPQWLGRRSFKERDCTKGTPTQTMS